MTSRVLTAVLTAALAAGSLAGLDSSASARTAVPHTELTLQVSGCDGCHLKLTQALNGRRKVWQSRQGTVRNGEVSWSIPTMRTHGVSISVVAPWDGGPGYLPTIAFRYGGMKVGDQVTNAIAKKKSRASTCWAGTTDDTFTMAITVVHARSTNPPGDPIRTPRAFASVTQDWEKPMERAWHGISGTQDVTYCG